MGGKEDSGVAGRTEFSGDAVGAAMEALGLKVFPTHSMEGSAGTGTVTVSGVGAAGPLGSDAGAGLDRSSQGRPTAGVDGVSREALSEMAEMAAWSSKLGTFDWDVLSLSEEGVKASVVLMFEALGLLVEEKAAGEGERDVGSLCGRGLGAASMGSVVVRGSTGAVEGILARRMSNKGSRSDNSRYVSARRDASVATGEVEHGGGDEVAQPGSERGKSRLDVPSLPEAQGVVTRESLECLMDCLRACYDDHPYHCWRHAVDVTHSAFTILTLAWGWVEEHLTTLDVLCLMVAALGHDVRHRGVSNQFLTRTGDLLALTYNDQSVQEMMHAASFFQLIRQEPRADVFALLDPSERQQARRLVISLILDTDMASHFRQTGTLEILADGVETGEEGGEWTTERIGQFLCAILHVSDLGHALKGPHLHARWTRRALSEFFAEAEMLKEIGSQPLPFMDPAKCFVPAAQMEYLDFVVRPFVVAMARIVPALAPLPRAVACNYTAWVELLRVEPGAPVSSRGSSKKGVSLASPPLAPPARTETSDSSGLVGGDGESEGAEGSEAAMAVALMGLPRAPEKVRAADPDDLRRAFLQKLGPFAPSARRDTRLDAR